MITVRIGHTESNHYVSGTYQSIAAADDALLPIRKDEERIPGRSCCKTIVTLVHESGDDYGLRLDISGLDSTIERSFRANFRWYLSERCESFLRRADNSDDYIAERQREARLWLSRLDGKPKPSQAAVVVQQSALCLG